MVLFSYIFNPNVVISKNHLDLDIKMKVAKGQALSTVPSPRFVYLPVEGRSSCSLNSSTPFSRPLVVLCFPTLSVQMQATVSCPGCPQGTFITRQVRRTLSKALEGNRAAAYITHCNLLWNITECLCR